MDQAQAVLPSMGSTLRPCTSIHCSVAPATITFLLAICMNTSTDWCLIPLHVSTGFVGKSHDHSVEECRFKNRSQVDSDRSGDGSMPCSLRMFRIVVRETDMMPSFRSSPSILEYPQPGDLDISSTSFRISADVRGLPMRFLVFLCLGARSHF